MQIESWTAKLEDIWPKKPEPLFFIIVIFQITSLFEKNGMVENYSLSVWKLCIVKYKLNIFDNKNKKFAHFYMGLTNCYALNNIY